MALKRSLVIPVDEVLPLLYDNTLGKEIAGSRISNRKVAKKQRISVAGFQVAINSLRLVTFKVKGLKCHLCGIEGSFFAIEQTVEGVRRNQYHLNLYARNSSGHEILMTQDHIKPKAVGGTNDLQNSQTLCSKCNHKKGHQYNEKI